jgi:hypothetical protein
VSLMKRIGLPAEGFAAETVEITPRLRQAVLAAWHHKCGYCTKQGAEHVDHIVPRALGGPDCLANFAAACAQCNLMKTDMLLAEPMLAILVQKALRKATEIRHALAVVDSMPDLEGRRAALRSELADWHVRDETVRLGKELDPAYEAQIRAEVETDYLEVGLTVLREEVARVRREVKAAEKEAARRG